MDFRPEPARNLFSQLNTLLATRISGGAIEPWLPWLYYISTALAKLPTQTLPRVFRGLSVPVATSDLYQAGRHVFWVALTSTTTERSVMLTFATGGGGSLVMMQDAVGYDVRDFSLFPAESEFLLAPNAHMTVVAAMSAAQALPLLQLALGDAASPAMTNDLLIVKQQRPTAGDNVLSTLC